MMIYLVIMAGVVLWLSGMAIMQRSAVSRELGRFNSETTSVVGDITTQFDQVAQYLADRTESDDTSKTTERERKYYDAGLETAAAQGRFLVFRLACYVIGPAAGATSYFYFLPYYATIFTLFTTVIGLAIPFMLIKSRTAIKREDIQRELPLLLDLTNLGTSAGWDVSSSLERVCDALYAEMPNHPLIREMRRARHLTASGYTWDEALSTISQRLGNENFRRTALALGQAIKQGGNRTSQLDGIAMDAQRLYYTDLDKRLAGLPVKAILVTMVLMIAYFLILMAPVVVQILQNVKWSGQ
jgi:Flp pilus assembly protein TadB